MMLSLKTRAKIKAVGLLSGGLDSTLAAKLMLEQGIELYAINFTSPFCTCTPKKAGCAAAVTAAKQLGGISLKRVRLGNEYLEIVRKPKHGYGSGLNPCIDCRIIKIRKAADYMREVGAAFLFTGEVVGQRRMSQHKAAIKLIDRESGLQGYIVRPLSAMVLEPTIPEKRGWVDRRKLLGITGRSRKIQITLAAEKGIHDYPCPAGGCLLTDKKFSDRMKDYFAFTEHPTLRDMALLKTGRHFRLACGDKLIVARNQSECEKLKSLYREADHLLIPLDFSGPTVVLQGNNINAAVDKMIAYTKKPVPQSSRISHWCKGTEQVVIIGEV